MKKFLELISEEMGKGFAEAGYEKELGRVTVSNRPDLCEYQCNGAMAGAKKYHKAPLMIANERICGGVGGCARIFEFKIKGQLCPQLCGGDGQGR